MFSFKPLSDEEIVKINNRDLLPDGNYPFLVKVAEFHTAESGNVSIKLTLLIYSPDNNDRRVVVDYMSSDPRFIFKIKHFCESIGLESVYLKGTIVGTDLGEFLDKEGIVKVGMQKGKAKKDGSGYYNDSNVAKDYIKTAKIANAPSEFNDDITF